MKTYVLTNGVDWLLFNGVAGRLHEGQPMYFNTMTDAGAEIVRRPILAFMDYRPTLIEINHEESTKALDHQGQAQGVDQGDDGQPPPQHD